MPGPVFPGDGLVRDIGTEVRRLRREKGMTLENVAQATGFSKMHISKIERGQVSSPLTTLHRIAMALRVSMTTIIEGADSRGEVAVSQDLSERDFMSLGQPGVRAAPLCHRPHDRIMLPLLVELEAGAETGGLSHPTDTQGKCEEWAYVLQGRVRLTMDNEVYEGRRGCTFYFSGAVPHLYTNPGKSKARFLVVRVPQV